MKQPLSDEVHQQQKVASAREIKLFNNKVAPKSSESGTEGSIDSGDKVQQGMMKSQNGGLFALCLITFRPNEKIEYLKFLNTFNSYDIYVIIDDNIGNYESLKSQFKNINFIQIDDKSCLIDGFSNLSFITLKKPVTGWDKAVYYFEKINTKYEKVWFFEDDVFFYSEETIINLDKKYKEQDILCNSSYEEGKLNEWLWNKIKIEFKPPYFCGMMCCIRLSKKFLSCINEYATKHKTLFFLEAFFPSIAKKYGLNIIKSPEEFKTITHRNTFNLNELNQNFLYHPKKNLEFHKTYRKYIELYVL